MIFFTAQIYEDELAYSWLARCWMRSGYSCYTDFLKKLCGDRLVPNVEFFKGFTNQAKEMISRNISIESLILKHTMFPQYARFLSKKDREQAVRYLIEGNSDYIKVLHLIRGNQGKERYLRYCPVCAKEDRSNYGETYWHRKHQIQGCGVCDKHGCRLIESSIKLTGFNSNVLRLAEFEISLDEYADYNVTQQDYDISKYLADVFEYEFATEDVSVNEFFHSAMENTKYMCVRGNLKNIKVFYEDYMEYYKGLENNPIKTEQNIKNAISGIRPSFYSICLLGMFLGISPSDLMQRKYKGESQLDKFDSQVKDLFNQGYSYKEIAKKLNTNYYITRTIVTGNTLKPYVKRKRKVRDLTAQWEKTDREYLPLVKAEIQRLLKEEKPQKISKKRVIEAIGRTMYVLPYLPLCSAEIEKYEEEIASHHAKKLMWATNEIRKDTSVNFTWYRVITKASVPLKQLPDCLPYLQDCEDLELMDMVHAAMKRMEGKKGVGKIVGEELYG